MDALIILAVAALLCLLAALPIAIAALIVAVRANRKAKDLDWRLQGMARTRRESEPVAAPPQPVAAVAPFTPAPAPRATPVAPPMAAPASGPVRAAPPPPPPPKAPPLPPPAARPERKPIRWEELIGLKLLAWAGIIVILLGAAFFIKYGYDRGWFGRYPWMRVVIPMIFGLGLLTAGEVFARKAYRVLSRVTTGGGIAALYWAAFTAWARFQAPLIPESVAWTFMAIITAVAILLAVRYSSLTVAILSLVGGVVAPLLIRPERDPGHTLFLYLVAVNAGVLVLAYFKKWRVLNLLALVGTIVNVVAWLYAHYWVNGAVATEKLGFVVTYMTILWAMFFALSIIHHLTGRRKHSELDLPLTLLNVVAYFAGLYILLKADHHFWLGPAAVVLGAAYLVEALFVRRWAPGEVRFALLQIGQALALLTLAIPIQLSGVFIPMAWAVEATVLYWMGLRIQDWRLRAVGLLVHACSIVALGYYAEEAWNIEGAAVFNARTATFAAVALAMALSAWLYRRLPGAQRSVIETGATATAAAAAHGLLMILISIEAYRWFESAHRALLHSPSATGFSDAIARLLWTRDMMVAMGLAVYGLAAVGLAAVLKRAFHHGAALVALAAGFIFLYAVRDDRPVLDLLAAWNSVGAVFAVAIACLALAAVISRYFTAPPAGRVLAVAYELLALGALLGLYLEELDRAADHMPTIYYYIPTATLESLAAAGLAAMAGIWLLRGFWIGSVAHRAAGFASMAVALGLLVWASTPGQAWYDTILWQPRGVAFLLAIAGITLTAVGYGRRMAADNPERRYAWPVLAVLVHIVALGCFTVEAQDFWSAHARQWFFGEEQSAWYARQATLSVGYALYAFALLAAGIRRRSALTRATALVILCGTLAKVLLLDLSRVEAIWRVLSIVGLGLFLLAASLLYYKYRHIIFPKTTEEGRRPAGAAAPRRIPMAWHKLAIFGAILTAACLASAARADFDPEAWRLSCDIKVPEGAAGANARFVVNNDMWDNAAGTDLRDLRIIRGETDDVGYVVYAPQEEPSTFVEHPARVFNIATRNTEASELTLDLGDNPPVTSRITIQTPAAEFGCAVTVEGSDDNRNWKTLRADAAIFAFGGEIRQRFTTVRIPDARMRYLRVVVSAPPNGKPIELSGATVSQETPAGKPDLPLLADRRVVERTESQESGQTLMTLDLGAMRLPLQTVTLQTSQQNFSRKIRLEVSDDNKQWAAAGTGVIFRMHTEKYQEEQLTVPFPETFGRYLRVWVANGDDPPLVLSQITVQGRPRYVFFPFEAGKQYRLFYGNPNARKPQYEYAAVFPRIDRGAAIEARLGEVHENPRFIATRAADTPPPWVQQNQWVLYVALAVAVVGLALVAMRALKKPVSDNPPPAP